MSPVAMPTISGAVSGHLVPLRMRRIRVVTPSLLVLLLLPHVLIGAEPSAAPSSRVAAIRDGQPWEVQFEGSAWKSTPTGLVGSGIGNIAWANRGIVGPRAEVQAKLSLDQLDHTAASIAFGDGSQFGLDAARGRLFVQGPTFSNATKYLDEIKNPIQPGQMFEWKLVANDKRLTISIDGQQVYETSYTPPLGRIGLRPWRATMTVQEFTLAGDVGQGTWLTKRLPWDVTIPTLDLTDQQDRQVILARGTKDVYQGHPTTLLMSDGKTMFAAWTYDHGGVCGPLKRSNDGGLTWSELLDVPDNWKQIRNCPCLHRLVDPQGVARLFVFAGNGAMHQSVSLDEGKTWSPMRPNGLQCIVAPITILPIEGGKKHLAVYHRGAGDRDRPPLRIWQATSADGGLTWEDQRMVAAVEGANPCEPFVLRSPDGKQLMCLMRENARRLNSLVMVSDDEGKTWTEPQEVTGALTGDRHCGRYAEDGRLVIAFRDMAKGSSTYGQFVAWIGTYEDILEGRPGEYRLHLLKHHGRTGDTGYPGLERLPDGTFVATTYVAYRPDEKNSVVSVRFTLNETDRMAKEQSPTVVWQSGTDGYDTYRIPALLRAQDGTLLAFCEGRRHSRSDTGAIDLLVKRSTDLGKTWSEQQVVWTDGDNTCGNPCPVVDQSTGRVHLLMTYNLGEDHESKIKLNTARGTRTVWVCHSDDHGQTWSQPREITATTKDPQWGWYATGPGVGIQIEHGPHKGRLVIPCDHSFSVDKSVDKQGFGFGSHVIYSDDHGQTWQRGGTLQPQMNECQTVELGQKGKLLIDMRSYRGQGCRAQATSTDGGKTWSEISDAKPLISPVCQASLIRYAWPDDDQPGLLLFSSPRDPAKRRNLTILGSFDDGQEWTWIKTLYPGHSAYSCLAPLGEGKIGCLAEIGEQNAYETISFFSVEAPRAGNAHP